MKTEPQGYDGWGYGIQEMCDKDLMVSCISLRCVWGKPLTKKAKAFAVSPQVKNESI